MTDEDPCSEQLSEVIHQFNRRGDIEPGLEVEEDALLQLRKACRILDGIRALRDIDRHYTLVVEGSFAAIERTVQFYVVHSEVAASAEITDHGDTFEYGARAGVFTTETAKELTELWKNYRNGLYYQQDRATAGQAAAMLAYAECLHEHVPTLAGRSHDCIC